MRSLALAVLALALPVSPAAAQIPDTTPLVSADGIGTATLAPDIAEFGVTVSRLARTSSGARSATNRRVAAILRAVRARGVAGARTRADDAAATQGLRITGVRSVTLAPQALDFGGDDSDAGGGAFERAASEPTQVSPGVQRFTERVRVVYTASPL
jgi:uncharacterized protein YggE